MKIKGLVQIFSVFCSIIIIAGCGGSSGSGVGGDGTSDDDGSSASGGDLSIEAQASAPTTASLSVPLPGLGKASIVPSLRFTETAATGVVVHAEDLVGTEIGNSCETDAEGKCTVDGLTQDQLEAGFKLVYEFANDAGTTVDVHAPVFLSTTKIAQVVAGETVTEPVNAETDMIGAICEDECGGSLEGCDGSTINVPVFIEAAAASITGEEPDDLTTGSAALQALYEAHGTAIAEAPEGSVPKDNLEAAIGGDTTAFVEQVGDTVIAFDATFDTAGIVSDTATVTSAIVVAYAQLEDTTWNDLKNNNADFNPFAVVGCIAFLPPAVAGEILPADFRAVANQFPQVEGGFSMMAVPQAQKTCAESFKEGLFDGAGDDPARAGMTFGTMTATFPPCPETGCAYISATDFTNVNFVPSVAASAATVGILAMGSGINYANYPPNVMRNSLNGTLSTNMTSFAVGGGNGFFQGLATAGSIENFVPATYTAEIKGAPGSSCDDNTDCLPCDSCQGGMCVAGSIKMGSSCTSSDDCDDLTACRVGFSANEGGHCMCVSVIPVNAPTVATAGGVVATYTPSSEGTTGAQCGTGFAACVTGRCSGETMGVCVSNDYKAGAYMPCSSNSGCMSDVCSNLICTAAASPAGGGTSSASGGAPGTSCTAPSYCASFICSPTTHTCQAPPTTGVLAGAVTGRANGETCAVPSDCASTFCCASTMKCTADASGCTPPAGGTGTPPAGGGSGASFGSPCTMNSMCMSGVCMGGFCGSGM